MKKILILVTSLATVSLGTLSSSYAPVSYNANGSVSSFAFPYTFFSTSDLIVYYVEEDGTSTILTEGRGAGKYTVAAPNNDYSQGATVTTGTAYSEGKIVIERSVPYGQQLEINGDFIPAEPLEQQLDKLAAQTQQVKNEIQRTLTIPVTDDSGIVTEFPNTASRASKIASFDEDGNLTVISPISSGTVYGGSGISVELNAISVLVDEETIDFDGNGDLAVVEEGIGEFQIADNAVSTDKIADESVTKAKLDPEILDPFQEYTFSSAVGGTHTISYSDGGAIQITATSPVTIDFNSDFPTNGINRVAVDFHTGTNEVSWGSSITNTSILFDTDGVTPVFFRKAGGSLWTGRQ